MINIIEDAPISLTRTEYDKLYNEYVNVNMYSTNPISFEEYVRSRKLSENLDTRELLKG